MKTSKATMGQPEFDQEIRVPRFIWKVTKAWHLVKNNEEGLKNLWAGQQKLLEAFDLQIPGPTSTGLDCSSGTSNFSGSTSLSGPTYPSIENYACDFPSGRTGAHPNLTSSGGFTPQTNAIHQSFPDCEIDACDFPSGSHPFLTWSGGFTSGTP